MTTRLKAILRKQGKTQFWLSRETGITCPDLSQVMNGKKYCFPGWRKKISQALNLPEEEIFTDTSKIDEARAEAYRCEGDKRTIERIAEMLAGDMKCPPGKCPGVNGDCRGHWLDYLTGEAGE